jgi:hypothetical protein
VAVWAFNMAVGSKNKARSANTQKPELTFFSFSDEVSLFFIEVLINKMTFNGIENKVKRKLTKSIVQNVVVKDLAGGLAEYLHCLKFKPLQGC